jgi:hypothetical protein
VRKAAHGKQPAAEYPGCYTRRGGPWGLAVGDINGDGRLDVASTNYSDKFSPMYATGEGETWLGTTLLEGLLRS